MTEERRRKEQPQWPHPARTSAIWWRGSLASGERHLEPHPGRRTDARRWPSTSDRAKNRPNTPPPCPGGQSLSLIP